MYLIIFSSFANSGTDITHLNQHARPGVTAYVGIDNKRMKYVKLLIVFVFMLLRRRNESYDWSKTFWSLIFLNY